MNTTTAQADASDPRASAFVAANAGSGKTATLVRRVARLLLDGARPEAILCVTYTKAAAAEMQRRLFDKLGAWAVASDRDLANELADIGEARRSGAALARARGLFARALDTPGGLKIQTLHAFCEQLLRRFPLEAGVPPGFTVLDDKDAAAIAERARAEVARLAEQGPGEAVGRAYAHFAVQLKGQAFDGLFARFADDRQAIIAYVERCAASGGEGLDVWRRCGFPAATSRVEIEADCLARIRWGQWRRAAARLAASDFTSDRDLGARMAAFGEGATAEQVWPLFLTKERTARKRMGTKSLDATTTAWLEAEREHHADACRRWIAAGVAEETCHALALASAYIGAYEAAKAARGALDFADLIAHAVRLVTERADAAWVLYKLDGGIDHVLLDEGQDTAPAQWDLLRALTAEFFTGLGARGDARTLFAVADEKQSIFSFQGAAPERFAAEKQHFHRLVEGAGAAFHSPVLRESWRSAPEILAFVDAVFADGEALRGLHSGGETVRPLPIVHKAGRGGAGGVDLWPLEAGGGAEVDDPWAPVDAPSEDDAGRKLARRIADDILRRVGAGEAVMDRAAKALRPCRFGDMMILVRRRNALFHEIIRALKRAGVTVGGADRLKLSDHGVFADLLARGRVARVPADDLTLAALLRSPFCDVDEQGLFDLAQPRAGGLWDELRRRAAERAVWEEALAFLDWAAAAAAAHAPFDFYGRVLSRLDARGRSMRQRLVTRMGSEGEHALEAFLAEVLAAETRGARDLERLIAELAATEIEVKREQDEAEGEGEVRVMTVHGAKGLEAPVVYLPDTTTRADDQGGALLPTEDGAFLWAPRKADDCPASAAAREARAAAIARESSRLLYVALTRARDRLVIAGVETKDHLFNNSWRDYIERAFGELPNRAIPHDGEREGRRFGHDPVVAADQARPGATTAALPEWIGRIAPAEPEGGAGLAPSRLSEAGAVASPLAEVGGMGRWRRGALIHDLLQRLPEIAPERRPDLARRLLAREPDLGEAQRSDIAAAVLAVLGEPRFAALFGPGSRAEVPLIGRLAGQTVSGRIDRLLVTPDAVLVVDYKTNRPPPARPEDVDPAYLRQMALYVGLLRRIHPNKAVAAALLWTDGPTLMPLPDTLVEQALVAAIGPGVAPARGGHTLLA